MKLFLYFANNKALVYFSQKPCKSMPSSKLCISSGQYIYWHSSQAQTNNLQDHNVRSAPLKNRGDLQEMVLLYSGQ